MIPTSREQSSRQIGDFYFQHLLKRLAGGALILIEGVGGADLVVSEDTGYRRHIRAVCYHKARCGVAQGVNCKVFRQSMLFEYQTCAEQKLVVGFVLDVLLLQRRFLLLLFYADFLAAVRQPKIMACRPTPRFTVFTY